MAGKKRPKDQRFREDAEKRVLSVLREMRKLEELADTKRYTFTEEQVEQVFQSINAAVHRAYGKFEQDDDEPGFAFE